MAFYVKVFLQGTADRKSFYHIYYMEKVSQLYIVCSPQDTGRKHIYLQYLQYKII